MPRKGAICGLSSHAENRTAKSRTARAHPSRSAGIDSERGFRRIEDEGNRGTREIVRGRDLSLLLDGDGPFRRSVREVALHELEVARRAVSIPGPAGGRLEGAIRIHVERALRRPRLAYAMLAEPLAPELEATRLIYRKSFHELFARVMEEAIEVGEYQPFDVKTAAACMIGAFDEALIWPLAFRTGDGDAPELDRKSVV